MSAGGNALRTVTREELISSTPRACVIRVHEGERASERTNERARACRSLGFSLFRCAISRDDTNVTQYDQCGAIAATARIDY